MSTFNKKRSYDDIGVEENLSDEEFYQMLFPEDSEALDKHPNEIEHLPSKKRKYSKDPDFIICNQPLPFLPNEILTEIFSWVTPTYNTIVNLKLVSKRWKSILDQKDEFEILSKDGELGRSLHALDLDFVISHYRKKEGFKKKNTLSYALCLDKLDCESFPVFKTEAEKLQMEEFVKSLYGTLRRKHFSQCIETVTF